MTAPERPPGLPADCTPLRRLAGGESAEAWLVERRGQRGVFRRREPGAGPGPRRQAELLRWLGAQGLPVAPVWEAGPAHLLCGWLPGVPGGDWFRARCGPERTAAAFALLARLHGLPAGPGTPPAALPRDRWRASLAPGPDAAFADLRRGAAAALAGLAPGGPGSALIHGDFHPANVLFTGEAVSGLLDFDTAQLSRGEFDLGYALLTFCGRWPDGTLDVEAAAAALAAYGAVRPWEGVLLAPCTVAAALILYDWCAALPAAHPRRAALVGHFGGLLRGRAWEALPGGRGA